MHFKSCRILFKSFYSGSAESCEASVIHTRRLWLKNKILWLFLKLFKKFYWVGTNFNKILCLQIKFVNKKRVTPRTPNLENPSTLCRAYENFQTKSIRSIFISFIFSLGPGECILKMLFLLFLVFDIEEHLQLIQCICVLMYSLLHFSFSIILKLVLKYI